MPRVPRRHRFPFAHGFFSWATAGTESQHRWMSSPLETNFTTSSMTWGWKSPLREQYCWENHLTASETTAKIAEATIALLKRTSPPVPWLGVGNRRRGSNTAQRITWLQARPQQRLLKLPLPGATSTVWIGAARHCLNRRRLESNWSHARNKEVPLSGCLCVQNRRGSNTAQRITWLQARPQQRLLKLPLPGATSTVWIGAARHCLNRRRLESNWSHARNKEVPLSGCLCVQNCFNAILLRESPGCKRDHSKDCWSYHCQGLPQPCGSVLQDTVSTDEGWKATGRTLGTRKCLSVGASAFKTAAGAILLRESPDCKWDHSKDCWSYHCQGLPQPCGSVLQDTVSTDEGWKATGRMLGTRKCLSVGASAFKIALMQYCWENHLTASETTAKIAEATISLLKRTSPQVPWLGLEIAAAGAILLRESPDCKRDHSKDCWSYHCQPLPQPCGSVLQDTVSTDEGWKATGRTLGTRKCLEPKWLR